MIVYGKPIAEKIYKSLKPVISSLKAKKIIPSLAIILVGNDPASKIYVRNKKKRGERLGIKVLVNHLTKKTNEKKLLTIIKNYNKDPNIHGIIVQLPLPSNIDEERIIKSIVREKDVDGFLKNSPFPNPLSLAVEHVLTTVKPEGLSLKAWLKNKKIVVVGRGRTAGEPIYNRLAKISSNIARVTHSTKNPEQIILKGDIVISCVGKKNIINRQNLKKGAILIGIGLHRKDGKLKGDYDEEEIKDIASFYTPTPKGMGPVNVACLLENVVQAAAKTK